MELGGSSVELPTAPFQRWAALAFPPADPAPAWSWAAPAWSSRRQIPLQRGAARLQRGVPASRPRSSVELGGSSVEFPPADPASVELDGPSVEFPPADPAPAWSWAAPAWSCRQQTPLQRGAGRLQRGVPAGRPRYSVELDGPSVEFPPADPAPAWSWAAPAWSSRQQTPLQRGAGRLQRGVPAGRSRSSVELGQRGAGWSGSSVEFRGRAPDSAVVGDAGFEPATSTV